MSQKSPIPSLSLSVLPPALQKAVKFPPLGNCGLPEVLTSIEHKGNKASGIQPLRLLFSKRNLFRLFKLPNSEGIVPVKLLLLNLNVTNSTKLPTEVEIVPNKLLKLKSKVLILILLHIELGMVPPMLFRFKTR